MQNVPTVTSTDADKCIQEIDQHVAHFSILFIVEFAWPPGAKVSIYSSSIFGSMTQAREVGYAPCPAYKISKTALNALMVQYALSYEYEGSVFMAARPGVGRKCPSDLQFDILTDLPSG